MYLYVEWFYSNCFFCLEKNPSLNQKKPPQKRLRSLPKDSVVAWWRPFDPHGHGVHVWDGGPVARKQRQGRGSTREILVAVDRVSNNHSMEIHQLSMLDVIMYCWIYWWLKFMMDVRMYHLNVDMDIPTLNVLNMISYHRDGPGQSVAKKTLDFLTKVSSKPPSNSLWPFRDG